MTLQAVSSTPSPRRSVFTPALNEALCPPHILARRPRDVHEVILVDGYSVDGTVTVSRRLWLDVHIVRQRRTGRGNAFACGFALATDDILAVIDADGPANPGAISQFVTALLDGTNFAKGTRSAEHCSSNEMMCLRSFANRLLTTFSDLFHGARYSGLYYGFNVFQWRHMLVLCPDTTSPSPSLAAPHHAPLLIDRRSRRDRLSVRESGSVNAANSDLWQRRFRTLFAAEAAADGRGGLYQDVVRNTRRNP